MLKRRKFSRFDLINDTLHSILPHNIGLDSGDAILSANVLEQFICRILIAHDGEDLHVASESRSND
jgi:hypothetical protein